MSDIFYSQVDRNLQIELNSRGAAGRYDRTTNSINFMLEKIANVQIIPYKEQDRKDAIASAILGGYTVRSGEYLPSGPDGFLTDRKYKYTERGITDAGSIVDKAKEQRTNSSRRIPPFITSMEIAIGDGSNGLLNTATVNITIPNPERDLNFIESVYFRPGRAVNIKIEHPQTAIVSDNITGGYITPDTMPSTKTLSELYPNLTPPGFLDYRKMNATIFDGLIIGFTFDYQTDMSVNATLSLTGTSQTYSDISLLMPSDDVVSQQPAPAATNIQNPNAPTIPATTNAQTPSADIVGTFYKNLNIQVDNVIKSKKTGIPAVYTSEDIEAATIVSEDESITQLYSPRAIWGEPFTGASYQRYINLSWLINYVNSVIIKKMSPTIPSARIVCTEYSDLVTSIYYEHLVSADPMKILLFGKNHNIYGDLEWYSNLPILENQHFSGKSEYIVDTTQQSIQSFPTRMFINMEVIQKIVTGLEKNKEFTVQAFLSYISSEINSATAGAVDLQLITHPELSQYSLFYDAAAIKFKDKNPVKPYAIPMFANHPAGTVVRDFKFSGKLPSDASQLAYAVNNDPSTLAESDIAPYLSYMYTANTVERTGPHETVGNLITQTQLDAIIAKYKENHLTFIDTLNKAKIKFGQDPTNPENQSALKQALQKYIQYPKPTIAESNKNAAPVIPFDVEFTIDGINGFRYGDILTFDALPTRYKQNAVFSVVGINHTVGSDGIWTTTVRCIMRPNIDS